MSATSIPTVYEFDVNGHTYHVRFEGYHALIVHGQRDYPLVIYLKEFIPEALHVQFLKAVVYVHKEFAL